MWTLVDILDLVAGPSWAQPKQVLGDVYEVITTKKIILFIIMLSLLFITFENIFEYLLYKDIQPNEIAIVKGIVEYTEIFENKSTKRLLIKIKHIANLFYNSDRFFLETDNPDFEGNALKGHLITLSILKKDLNEIKRGKSPLGNDIEVFSIDTSRNYLNINQINESRQEMINYGLHNSIYIFILFLLCLFFLIKKGWLAEIISSFIKAIKRR